jgi:hypothetical protein
MRAPTMTTTYGDKEREFLNALEADTGRTLSQWMDAIRAEGLAERNDIIDWLRRQGFRFSRASWLERVHHNGGKPIYADRPAGEPRAPRRTPTPASAPEQRTSVAARQASTSVLGSSVLPVPAAPKPSRPPQPPAAPETPRPAADAYASVASNVVPLTFTDPLSPEITNLTAKAKAYRPLADFLLREIAKAVPSASFGVRGQQIVVASAGREFASLAISARELKLAIAQSGAQAGAVSLTDARQVDAALLDRIKAAATTAS